MATKYDNMSMDQLRKMACNAEDEKARASEILNDIKREVARRISADIDEAYREKGKLTGIARVVSEGVPIKLNRPETVKINQDAAKELAKSIGAENAKNLFVVDIKIPASKYKDIDDIELKKKVDKIRTIKPGSLSIDFEIKV